MANNRIVRYVTNTALLAVLAAAGIGVYQLGTSGTDVEIQEEAPSYLDDTADTKENEDSAVDAGTSLVEAEMKEEGAPVLASVPGTVYSIEEDPQTGTTVTMEIGSGYQAVYGQLKDLTVEEGDTVTKGTVIGYVGTPTKYYSKEGSNLYFAMKKNGEPVDPIAYLP